MEDNAPKDSPKKISTSSVITLAVIGTLFAVFVGFVLFYPTGERSGEDNGTVATQGDFGQRPADGSPAPDFSLTGTDGRQWTLSELKGKVVLVNFWATWCPPCRQEMPTIDHLDELNASNEDFQILTILYRDNPEAATAYFESNDFNMPILLDPDSTTAKSYGLTGVPETFIIDKRGLVRRKVIGPPPGGFDTPEYLKYFEDLFAE